MPFNKLIYNRIFNLALLNNKMKEFNKLIYNRIFNLALLNNKMIKFKLHKIYYKFYIINKKIMNYNNRNNNK